MGLLHVYTKEGIPLLPEDAVSELTKSAFVCGVVGAADAAGCDHTG